MKNLKDFFLRTVFVTHGWKGGDGKSKTVDACMSSLRMKGIPCVGYETDLVNSSLAQIGLAEEDPWDLLDPLTRGKFFAIAKQFEKGATGCVFIDLAAQHGPIFHEIIDEFDRRLKRASAQLIVLRPLDASVHGASEAVKFAKEFEHIPQIVWINLGRVRSPKECIGWTGTNGRKKALEGLTVEAVLEDFSARVAANSAAFGLSMLDVANGNFKHLKPEELERAKAVFDDATSLFVEERLDNHFATLQEAVQQVRRKLEGYIDEAVDGP
ncbi:hypothetical protein [Phreatobacter sp.]|uniref:hypothetical protein n=1 Tax=Phreatobacter sp. TaxID=1966341 RepID=UPI0025D1759F|nr:hypothetical protein [Phreatobacter sp.]